MKQIGLLVVGMVGVGLVGVGLVELVVGVGLVGVELVVGLAVIELFDELVDFDSCNWMSSSFGSCLFQRLDRVFRLMLVLHNL